MKLRDQKQEDVLHAANVQGDNICFYTSLHHYRHKREKNLLVDDPGISSILFISLLFALLA